MPLDPSTRIGPYEVSGPLGAGGMGEVYRARDTKLGRDVAIKTLPASFAGDQERLARFEREAQLLAALNHAGIAAVYGLDVHDGTLYLAMELVEGETLEHKLKGGALPVEEAVRLALQIAEALEAAHDKGVVHRDLKPANIMVTHASQVKVLDFGLAKAFAGDPKEGTPAHSPALSLAMTQQGLVLGTAGYMAPEQASGQATDQRADIWAFGVVLYEMLTGLPLFRGESVPHILADVLKTEPDWSRLPKNLHPRLKLLLERCLTKRPRDRLHSIADARVELEAVLGAPEGVTPARILAAPERRHPALLAGVAAGAAILAGVLVWFLRPQSAPESEPVVRFSIPIPADQGFTANPVSMIAMSPDGTRIAYIANRQIFLRNLAESEARPVQGTDAGAITAAQPAFSPDGQWLAYVYVSAAAGPYLVKRVPVAGGAPVTLYQASGPGTVPRGLSWPTPDTILFTDNTGVVRIPANGGAKEVLVPLGEDERFDSPQLLPGGDTVLFTRTPGLPTTVGGYEAAQIVAQSIGENDRTVVWDGGSAARFLPTGHLVYAQDTALFAIAFNADTRSVEGGPVPLIDNLRRSSSGASDAANFAVSDTGNLAMIPGDPNANDNTGAQNTLAWVDRSGRAEPLPVRPDEYTIARVSPDGTKVALVVGGRLISNTQPAIWLFDERTENLSLLVADPDGDDGPVWSSDSRRIYFRAFRDETNGAEVHSIEIDTGERTVVASSSDHPYPLPWTIAPDDSVLGLVDALNLQNIDISTFSLTDGEFTSLLNSATSENEPTISANGEWLAYAESSNPGDPDSEINVRPFPGVARTRIPVGRGMTPVFSRDGSELFFVAGTELMAAPVTYEPTLRVGTPRRVFESNAYQWATVGRAWDVDPSGERFLMIVRPGVEQAADGRTNDRIDVVLNWFEEINARAPTQ